MFEMLTLDTSDCEGGSYSCNETCECHCRCASLRSRGELKEQDVLLFFCFSGVSYIAARWGSIEHQPSFLNMI